VGDVFELPYNEGVFDAANCSSHMGIFHDMSKAVRNIKRTLRTGGVLVMASDILSKKLQMDEIMQKDGTCHAIIMNIEPDEAMRLNQKILENRYNGNLDMKNDDICDKPEEFIPFMEKQGFRLRDYRTFYGDTRYMAAFEK